MSIFRFSEQIWPSLMSQAYKDYVPKHTDLFPKVIVKKLTQKQIEKASKGDMREAEAASGQVNKSNTSILELKDLPRVY